MVYSEIENLARALPVGEKMRLAQVLMSDAAWSQVQPLELDAIQVTELEIDDVTAELEKAQLMKLSEESARRWAGKTFDLRMSIDAFGSPDLFAEEFRIKL